MTHQEVNATLETIEKPIVETVNDLSEKQRTSLAIELLTSLPKRSQAALDVLNYAEGHYSNA